MARTQAPASPAAAAAALPPADHPLPTAGGCWVVGADGRLQRDPAEPFHTPPALDGDGGTTEPAPE